MDTTLKSFRRRIDEADFAEKLSKHCTWYAEGGYDVSPFRRNRTSNSPFINSKAGGRIPHGSYGLSILLELLPSWKGWPERTNSVSMNAGGVEPTSDPTTRHNRMRNATGGFGLNLYEIFPLDGARVAVAPTSDINFGFNGYKEMDFGGNLRMSWDATKYIINDIYNPRYAEDPHSYFHKAQEVIESERMDKIISSSHKMSSSLYEEQMRLFVHLCREQGIKDVLSRGMAPEPNGYRLMGVAEAARYVSALDDQVECWTDDEYVGRLIED